MLRCILIWMRFICPFSDYFLIPNILFLLVFKKTETRWLICYFILVNIKYLVLCNDLRIYNECGLIDLFCVALLNFKKYIYIILCFLCCVALLYFMLVAKSGLILSNNLNKQCHVLITRWFWWCSRREWIDESALVDKRSPYLFVDCCLVLQALEDGRSRGYSATRLR